MARIRSVKPGFWKSLGLWRAFGVRRVDDDSVRLTFIGLWNYADDEGRGLDDPRLIKAEIFPLDDRKTPAVIGAMVEALAAGPDPALVRYEVDGRAYFQILRWHNHQKVEKPQPSTIPPPPFPVDSGKRRGRRPERSGLEVEKEKEVEVEVEVERVTASSSSEVPQGEPGPVDDDDESRKRITEACLLIANRKLAQREAEKGAVGDRAAWLREALERELGNHAERARALLAQRADLPAAGLAELLEPPVVMVRSGPAVPAPFERDDAEPLAADEGRALAQEARAALRSA